jgi:hypothetical protein
VFGSALVLMRIRIQGAKQMRIYADPDLAPVRTLAFTQKVNFYIKYSYFIQVIVHKEYLLRRYYKCLSERLKIRFIC